MLACLWSIAIGRLGSPVLLGSLVMLAAVGSAAPPDSLSLRVAHTVLDSYDTDDGPATELEVTITNTGVSELYDLVLDFDLNAPPPPNRIKKIDDRVRVRTLRAGESVTLFWVVTLNAPVPPRHPLFAAVRAVDVATQQSVHDTLVSVGREMRR